MPHLLSMPHTQLFYLLESHSLFVTCVRAVAPLTNVSIWSLSYQRYLNTIFHRTYLAFFTHFSTIPFINFYTMVALSLLEFRSGREGGKSWADASLAWATTLYCWYCAWGLGGGIWWMGPPMILYLGPMYAAAHYYAAQLCVPPSHPDFLWYNPTPGSLFLNPFFMICFVSYIQCLSHVFEDIPPRFNGLNRWMRPSQFYCYDHTSLYDWTLRVLRSIFQSVPGAISELFAAYRLFPVYWSLYLGSKVLMVVAPSSPTLRKLLDDEAKFAECLSKDHGARVPYEDDTQATPVAQKLLPSFWRRVFGDTFCALSDPYEIVPNPALDYVGWGGSSYLLPTGTARHAVVSECCGLNCGSETILDASVQQFELVSPPARYIKLTDVLLGTPVLKELPAPVPKQLV